MTTARNNIVLEGEDGIYHCISRCVRRAFLCGFDKLTGKSFDHRKVIILERLKFLSQIFAIDILTYALMSNHIHLLLRILQANLDALSDEEVAIRWLKLYPVHKTGKEPSVLEIKNLTSNEKRIKVLRHRLGSISWFMKSLNEYIARIANKEDSCKGRFWEGRFKSQRLDSEAAVLSCSVYIDLNPIRAKIADTPEESLFTGVYERIQSLKAREKIKIIKTQANTNKQSIGKLKIQSKMSSWLCDLEIKGRSNGYLSINLDSYLELVDWTGRQIKKGKKGAIPQHLQNILQRLEVNDKAWVDTTTHYGKWFCNIVASFKEMKKTAAKIGLCWLKGQSAAKIAYTN